MLSFTAVRGLGVARTVHIRQSKRPLGDAGDGGQSARLGVLINVSGAERNIRVVSGRQKYCSEKCQREACLAWQRERKRDYNKTSGQEVKKMERRKQVRKVCVYCGRIFMSDKPTNLCSEYCKNEQKKLTQCKADIKRGYNRNMQKYIDKREKYREKQKMNERKESS